MKKKNIWNQLSFWLRAFLILALVFLALGLGTLGTAASTGDSYVLSAKREADGKEPCVIFTVSVPDSVEEDRGQLYIKEVYFNVGAVYAEPGAVATVRFGRGTSQTGSFPNYQDLNFSSFSAKPDSSRATTPYENSLFNWVKFSVPSTSGSGWNINTYPYYRLIARNYNIMLNEVVFVANDEKSEGDPVVLDVKINDHSVLPFDREKGETHATAIKRAGAIIDSPQLPVTAQSSFFQYGPEETATLLTIAEMNRGGSYGPDETYSLDGVYNSLGVDAVALGTAIFGISPFGLRFVPMLASFGVLVLGFLFVRKLLGSDKAGFVFALLYALCGASFSLGHFGTPLMVGMFFLVAALYCACIYFKDGMKKANFVSMIPTLLAGLFSAAAICVNGAFLVPVLGVAALYAAGVVRQNRADRAVLDAAIDEAEKEDAVRLASDAEADPEAAPAPAPAREHVARTVREHRIKTLASPLLYCALTVIGTFLISTLAALPLYFTYVKLYDLPQAPSRNFFYFVWKAFAGGFAGKSVVEVPSAWSLVYPLFSGTGATYAVTAAGMLVSIAAIATGVVGGVLVILRLVRCLNDERFREEFLSVLVLCVGFVLCLATAAFARGALAFLYLAWFFLFAIAGKAAATKEEGTLGTAIKVISYVCLAALVICFALFAVFTFSIPTSGFMSALF